jgi:hypothetical protein
LSADKHRLVVVARKPAEGDTAHHLSEAR